MFLANSILIPSILVGQVVDNTVMNSFSKSEELRRTLNTTNSRQVSGFDNRYEGVKGSPYLFDEWLEGTLTLSDSAVVRDRMLYKFDLINNTIWVKLRTGEERILYNKDLLSLELKANTGSKYLIQKIKLPDVNERNHFSIILFESAHITLVKDVRKIFRKANLEDKGIVTVGKAYDWFEDVVKYYIKVDNKSYFQEINLKKSDLISLAPKSHEKMIDQYCKANDIHGKLNDLEAVKLVKYISDLKL